MNELEFSFDPAAWEVYIDNLRSGEAASAATLLTLTEGEDEAVLEEALELLEERGMDLDISALPQSIGTGEAALRLRQEIQFAAGGMNPRELEENDPLRLYLEEVAMTPAFGDEQLLAERSAMGDESAMAALTNLSLSCVIAAARAHVGRGVLLLDLIQEGSLGLWKAIQSYDSGEFSTLRDKWINFYMAKALILQAHAGGVGQKMRAAVEDYRSVDERLLGELGRNPTVEEIAEALHMTADAAAALGAMVDNARMLAQVKKAPEPEEEEIAETQAVEDTAYFQMRQRIADLLDGLNEEDTRLITLRYGLEGGLPLSPEDTGKRLGLTPAEVVAREAAALARLRNK